MSVHVPVRRHASGGVAGDVGDDPSDLYSELYGDWHQVAVDVTAHSSNAQTSTRSGRTEIIWSNRPLTSAPRLFDDVEVVA